MNFMPLCLSASVFALTLPLKPTPHHPWLSYTHPNFKLIPVYCHDLNHQPLSHHYHFCDHYPWHNHHHHPINSECLSEMPPIILAKHPARNSESMWIKLNWTAYKQFLKNRNKKFRGKAYDCYFNHIIQQIIINNNYSLSPNGLLVNSPWGQRPHGLSTQRPWGWVSELF